MTLAAEVGGVAIVLQLLSGLPYRALVVVGVVALVLVIWTLPFEWIERIFGYGASACSCSRSQRSSSIRTGARSRTASCRDRQRRTAGLRATSSSACSAPR